MSEGLPAGGGGVEVRKVVPSRKRGGRGGNAVDAVLVLVILGLALTSAVLIYGFISSRGGQAAQLAPRTPSPSFGLMPMGRAHIPTSNACVLCHESGGGAVKEPPTILHPIEGWRRCNACHTNEALGRTAPGHDGIAETECLNCHKTGQAGPAITQPHAALQNQHCLACHGSVAHLPSTMAGSSEADCILCHQPATLPPPAYPHASVVNLTCRSCHQSAEAGALPIDHARRSDDTCVLCHVIDVVRASAGAAAPASARPSAVP